MPIGPNDPVLVSAAPRGEPVRVVVDQPSGFSRFLRWAPWALLGISFLVNMGMYGAYHQYQQSDPDLKEHLFSHEVAGTDKIAILDVSGIIGTGEGFVKRQIDHIRKDDNVRAIVLRVNSPGGTIVGSHLIFHRIKQLAKEKKIPVVVSMGGLAASGGYYVSMAVGVNRELGFSNEADQIYAEPTTTTGSIGVILPHYNIEGLMKEWKVEEDSVKSHRLKDMGTITRKMTDEERAKFQAYIDESLARFKQVIRYGRPHFERNPAELDALATGEVFTTSQALRSKLVDHEGFLEDAVDAAIKLADLEESNVRVVRYDPPTTLVDLIAGGSAQSESPSSVSTLLEMATPRGYYLYSWFPVVSAAARER
jgi:protease-4